MLDCSEFLSLPAPLAAAVVRTLEAAALALVAIDPAGAVRLAFLAAELRREEAAQ